MLSGDLGLYGERLAVVLGFVALALFIGMALTCRSFVSIAYKLKLEGLTNSRTYQKLFKLHSFFWYGLGLILFLHVITGIMHTELPRAGDRDAGIHWAILIFAFGLIGSVSLTFSNCRVFAGFLRIFRGEDLFAGVYRPFYGFHSYFWILLLVALVGHLIASYIHIGFWPTG